mmetsp:Transcript_19811/g.53376  ORF Transcript_19811/g.53376 Transcript_19811/m.53376 type:complete len:174 (-) Transcript_19811:483-1004(-)
MQLFPLLLCALVASVSSYTIHRTPRTRVLRPHAVQTRVFMGPKENDAEAVTKKYGLEAGLFKALTSKEEEGAEGKSGMATAKDLLAQYGSAYLLTSIPLAIISFTICYLLVDNGVDVAALLAKVGIEVSGLSEKAGTVAIAYAAHKAASPIRFPPTVALTPVVAQLIGKKKEE